MPKYLLYGSYTPDGVKGLLKEGGTARRQTVQQWWESQGGKVEAVYFAFGDNDFYCIYEAPDTVTAVATELISNALGLLKASNVVLITPEEMDEACRKAGSYRPPGA
jgi:uncharacterized protein with GYD domain